MANLDEFYPFDAGAGANVTEDQWRKFARHFLGTGVISGELNKFAVTESSPAAMSVKVDTGEAYIRGHFGRNAAAATLAIASADPSNPRDDRIVLRADFSANTISLEVLQGTPAVSPSPPALTQSTSRWEISLAKVRVGAGVTSIMNANITDERTLISPDIATIADAKGDVLVASAADTLARLAVGTNGQVLTADSAAALGVKWGSATLSRVTTLPASPTDGQEVAFIADDADNVDWHLKYWAAGGVWRKLGGPPLYAFVAAREATSGTGIYGALATAGPSIILPLAGTYEVEIGLHSDGAASGIMSYDIGATGAVDADAVGFYGGVTAGYYTSWPQRKSLSAVTLTSKYRDTGASRNIGKRWMRVNPVFVTA